MSEKVKKFVRGAGIAAAGAALAYVSGVVIPDLEISGVSATTVAILSMAVNGIKLLLAKVE